jgi:hypothetical protein
MMHFWILKYLLYSLFTKKNIISSYYEGGCLGILAIIPIISILMLLKLYEKVIILPLVLFLLAIETYISWNDDKVFSKYRYIERNKDSLRSKFKQVYWFIFLDILFFISTLIFVTIRRFCYI